MFSVKLETVPGSFCHSAHTSLLSHTVPPPNTYTHLLCTPRCEDVAHHKPFLLVQNVPALHPSPSNA